VLTGVTALAPNNVLAVGFYAKDVNTDRPTKTLIEHWDGCRLSPVPTSDLTPCTNPTTSGYYHGLSQRRLGLR
jgi:hypothetical protein